MKCGLLTYGKDMKYQKYKKYPKNLGLIRIKFVDSVRSYMTMNLMICTSQPVLEIQWNEETTMDWSHI
jgi:hypothetical protein